MPSGSAFRDCLNQHSRLQARAQNASDRIKDIRAEFTHCATQFSNYEAFVYCGGSLGRGDVGSKSDLDLFIVTKKPMEELKRLTEVRLLAHAIEINEKLQYGPFSNDGQYLKVYSQGAMLEALGAPDDDSENLFTARMLLLLESKCVCGEQAYDESINRIIAHYFRDRRGKRSFRPLFLLNDLLRYWRTLCLNYELTRDIEGRPWRKKNINLKFSRMLTIFGTVFPIVAGKIDSEEAVSKLVALSPHERFACGLDKLNDESILTKYSQFLNDYESFLCWKEIDNTELEGKLEELDRNAKIVASRFSDFVYAVVTHQDLDPDMKKYLVL